MIVPNTQCSRVRQRGLRTACPRDFLEPSFGHEQLSQFGYRETYIEDGADVGVQIEGPTKADDR